MGTRFLSFVLFLIALATVPQPMRWVAFLVGAVVYALHSIGAAVEDLRHD